MGTLASLPYDAKWSPVIETQAAIHGIGAVPLYGVDLVANALAGSSGEDEPFADSILMSEPLSKRTSTAALQINIAGRSRRFESVRVLKGSTGEFLLLDIAEAQQELRRFGRIDRIDVSLGPEEDFAAFEAAVRKILPAGYRIRRPGARTEENQRMLSAFRWNLRVLSYISLVVGAFLIYNTVSVSVVRRRAEIGVLRAIGASRATVLALFLAEALLFGLVGAALGILLGRLLAAGAVGLIAGTVNALFTTSRPAPVMLTGGEIAAAMVTGIAVAVLSALAPAREAMSVAPTDAMGSGSREHHARMRWRRGLVWAALFGAAAVAAAQAPAWRGFPVAGYASALLAIAAAAMAAPAVVVAVNRATAGIVRRRAETLLAGRSLAASLSRTSVVVAALATAIAMMASVGIMVGSFRQTVSVWLDVQLRADLYLRPAVPPSAGEFPPLAPEVGRILAATPGIAAVDLFHALAIEYRGRRATLGAGDLDIVRRYGRLRFLRGQDRDAILRSLPGRDRAIVSEPFANRNGVRAGDVLAIPLGGRTVSLTVAGVYYEYSSSQGYVIVDRSTLLRYLPDQPATNAAIYLVPGANAESVRRDLQLSTAALGVSIAPNSELRRNSIQIFDRTFAITWALEAVAIVVAMLGAANSLLALVLDRRREFGLLRYLGASGVQIRTMILTEAAFLGGLSILLGLALGFALSVVLIFVVNKQSFGWTIQFHPPGVLLVAALGLVWCVTVLAGLYPARVAARLNPIDVVHEE
jgi:putative ABC transport system permease protein